MVFGKTGQVATELNAFDEVKAIGRNQVDLSDPKECVSAIQLHKPQAVINAAAYTSVDEAEIETELAFLVNGEAPGAMAMACRDLNIPMVQISTDYVFDGSGTVPWRVSDATNPKNVYGRSKLKGEELITSSGCIYAILRTSWVVSSRGKNFVKTMLRLSEERDCLTVVDDQIGGPTWARDVAKTCVSIAKQLMQDSNKTGVYHYSGHPDVSWCQFASEIFEKTSRQTSVQPITTSEYPTPAFRPSNSRLDCTLTESVFGIPRPYWRIGLKDILEELENEHGGT